MTDAEREKEAWKIAQLAATLFAGRCESWQKAVDQAKEILQSARDDTSVVVMPSKSKTEEKLSLAPTPVISEQSMIRVEDIFWFSERIQNCLKNDGINTVQDLIDNSESYLRRIRGMGANSIHDVKMILAKLGLSLAPDQRNS